MDCRLLGRYCQCDNRSDTIYTRDDDRDVVYFQANIHAGEAEGKETALLLARSLALGQVPAHP
ncbi:MAG TPA: hypothetical protein QF499_10535 [Gammaproteobacteria bacterium]|nr:hypothetical protein [Chromatiales bacterium]MCP4925519.1 M14 family metallopeptidase [Gammaproteobacteria bacterium]HJP39544.1 hypothetical protein [Gammaproteobacteria bacterium]